MSSTTTLSAAAADRKARLAQLKSLKRKQPPDTTDDGETAEVKDESAAPRPAKSPRTASASLAPQDEAREGEGRGQELDGEMEEESVAAAILSGRNYDPVTKGPRLGFETDPSLAAGSATVEKRAQALSDEVKAQLAAERAEAEREEQHQGGDEAGPAQRQGQQLDLFKLRPKKPNWDLKRRLDERMRVVDVRTENAIARLVRERIEGRKKVQTEEAAGNGRSGSDGQPGAEGAGEDGDGELGIEGSALVEATKEREREAEEDARREREADAELEAT